MALASHTLHDGLSGSLALADGWVGSAGPSEGLGSSRSRDDGDAVLGGLREDEAVWAGSAVLGCQ